MTGEFHRKLGPEAVIPSPPLGCIGPELCFPDTVNSLSSPCHYLHILVALST